MILSSSNHIFSSHSTLLQLKVNTWGGQTTQVEQHNLVTWKLSTLHYKTKTPATGSLAQSQINSDKLLSFTWQLKAPSKTASAPICVNLDHHKKLTEHKSSASHPAPTINKLITCYKLAASSNFLIISRNWDQNPQQLKEKNINFTVNVSMHVQCS